MGAYNILKTKIDPKKIQDLNVKGKLLKWLEENTVKFLYDLGIWQDFLNDMKAHQENINQFNCTKTRSFKK